MTINFSPNDAFAIVYCIDRISLLDIKLIVCWKKSTSFQYEIALNGIWIFLTPKGGGRHLFL